MKILRLIGLAIASLCASPAFAGGGDPWSGFYVGATAGGILQQGCNTLTAEGQWPDIVPTEAAALGAIGTGCGNTATGFVGGVTAGANMAMGGMVFGIETDLSGTTGTSTYQGSASLAPDSANTATTTETTSIPWIATIRPRIGVEVSNNLMIYATGGLSIAQLNSSAQTVYTATSGGAFVDESSGSASAVVAGWTIGAGAEVALGGGWSLKGEYLYTDLSDVSYNTFFSSGLQPFYTDNISALAHVSMLRLGLNYRLGMPQFENSGGADLDLAVHRNSNNWSGLYGGITLGGAFGQSTAVDTDVGFGPWIADGDTFTANTSGPAGTVEVGYNWQKGAAVFGIEADAGYLGFKGSASSSQDVETMLTSSGGLAGTFRGRVGLTNGRVLAFATGGVIVGDMRSTVNDPYIDYPSGPSVGATFTSNSGTQTGWTAGGGLALALNDKWSVRAEYDYFDLGTKLVSGPMLNPSGGPEYYGWTIHNRGSVVKVGIDRKF